METSSWKISNWGLCWRRRRDSPSEGTILAIFLEMKAGRGDQTPWPEFASGLYTPSDRSMSAKFVSTFEDTGSHMATVTDPYGRIITFLDRSRYFFCQVAPQLYSRGWVDPITDPLLLRKSGSTGNRTRTSGSAARNSDHYTTEVVRNERKPWKKSISTEGNNKPPKQQMVINLRQVSIKHHSQRYF
jgi:hypothetical protein